MVERGRRKSKGNQGKLASPWFGKEDWISFSNREHSFVITLVMIQIEASNLSLWKEHLQHCKLQSRMEQVFLPELV